MNQVRETRSRLETEMQIGMRNNASQEEISRWKKKGDDTQGKANQSEWEKQNTAERGTDVNWEHGLLVCNISTLQPNYSCLSLSLSALFGKSAVNHQKTKSCQVLFKTGFKSTFCHLFDDKQLLLHHTLTRTWFSFSLFSSLSIKHCVPFSVWIRGTKL